MLIAWEYVIQNLFLELDAIEISASYEQTSQTYTSYSRYCEWMQDFATSGTQLHEKKTSYMDALARTRRGCCQMEDFCTYSITPYVKILIP